MTNEEILETLGAQLNRIEAKVDALAAAVPAQANAVPEPTSLPMRAVLASEVDELVAKIHAAFPEASEGAEYLAPFLAYRNVDDAFTYISDAVRTFGSWYNLGNFHMLYQTLAFRSRVPGPFHYEPPPPAVGSLPPTKVPAEILERSEKGMSWAGDPPVGPDDLGLRAEIYSRVLAKDSGAAPDWYEASADAVKVLVCGTGFNPFGHGMLAGDAYPCPGVYDLAGVCAAITGGGKPGGF